MPVPESEDTQKEVAETKTVTRPTTVARPHRTADKRAAAILAKKKQRRAAHRVTLRRSHTKG
jgi:hypothetical protein